MIQFAYNNMVKLVCVIALTVVHINFVVGQQTFIGTNQTVNRVINLDQSKPLPSTEAPALNPTKIQYDTIPEVLRTAAPVANEPAKLHQPSPAKDRQLPATQSQPATKTNPLTPAATAPEKAKQSFAASTNTVKSSSQLLVEISSPEFINVNQAAQVKIKLSNQSNQAIQQVFLAAQIPSHAKLGHASPKPVESNQNVYGFEITNLKAKAAREIVLDLIPTQKLPLNVATQIQIANEQNTFVAVRQPVLSLKWNGSEQAILGKNMTHEVVVTNTGDGVAQDVELATIFPADVKQIRQSRKSKLGNLNPGQSATIVFETLPLTAGSMNLQAQAAGTGIENQQTAIDVSVLQPELQVSTVGPKLNFVKRDGIYSINLTNTGQVDITDTRVALAVPAGLKITTVSREVQLNNNDGTLFWQFDKISANTSEKIQFKATAIEEGEQLCKLFVNSNETQEKQLALATQVISRADVSVRIRNLTGPVQVGDSAEFLVEVENLGSRPADNVNVRVALPTTMLVLKTTDGSVDENQNSLTFKSDQIGVGKKLSFKFSAVGSAKGEHVVRSTLQAGTSERDVIAEDTVFVYEIDQTKVSESLSPVIPR